MPRVRQSCLPPFPAPAASDLRVWVTRSEPGCSRQTAALRAAGFDAVALPVLAIEPTGNRVPEGPFDHVFFLSEQAVRHAGDLAFTHGARVYSVGAQTAARLSEAGIDSRVPLQAASEGLIAALDGVRLTGQACLVVAGEDGRKTLIHYLEGRQAEVAEHLCYRRVALDVWDPQLAGVTHILVASQDGFRAMARLWCANGGDSDVQVIAASNRIAALGPELGFSRVEVADGAADADFIAALEAQ